MLRHAFSPNTRHHACSFVTLFSAAADFRLLPPSPACRYLHRHADTLLVHDYAIECWSGEECPSPAPEKIVVIDEQAAVYEL